MQMQATTPSSTQTLSLEPFVVQLLFQFPLVQMDIVNMCLKSPHHCALHLLILEYPCMHPTFLEMDHLHKEL